MDPSMVKLAEELLAAEIPKIISITVLIGVCLAFFLLIVYDRVKSRQFHRLLEADRAKAREAQAQDQVAIGLVNLAAGMTEQNKTFIAAIEAIRIQLSHEGDLTRQTLITLTKAYEMHANSEEERIKMQRQVSERYAASIDANTETLHAANKTILGLESALNETTNGVTMANRRLNERLDKQAESLAEMIGQIKTLPVDVGGVVGQRLELALSEFMEAKSLILNQLHHSEETIVRAVREVESALGKAEGVREAVSALVPDML